MVQKPEIQYVGQFYVYGSEAKKLEPKRQNERRNVIQPAAQPRQERVISIDPVALVGLIVALVMLTSLVIGGVNISSAWQEYDAISQYMTDLKQENSRLEHQYRTGYNLEEIEAAALAIGMIPATEAKTMIISVSIPEPEPEPTVWEEMAWFVKGLFA